MRDILLHFGLLIGRVCFGAGMAYHGYFKVFGGKMEGFSQGVAEMGFPFPMFFAYAAALSEFAGGILVVAGFQTRLASFMIACTMFVAAFIRHADDPFRVKELALAYAVFAVVFIFTGAGKKSLDAKLKLEKY